MNRLEISLFGSCQLRQENCIPLRFRTNKSLALFVYLICETDRVHYRENLADLLWPELSAGPSRACLRQSLHRIRTTLAPIQPPILCLRTSLNAIQLTCTGDLWLDTVEFDRIGSLCEQHSCGAIFCDDCVNRLRRMVDLYRGDFLAGFSLPDAPRFDWWLFTKRNFYLDQIMEVLTRLAEFYECCQDFPQAMKFCQKQIELDAAREPAHLHYMRLLAITGQRSKALHHYDLCCRILQQDLGIEPSAELKDLYQRIHDDEISDD
jgi:DNA-binding SARP family transcriptional activator